MILNKYFLEIPFSITLKSPSNKHRCTPLRTLFGKQRTPWVQPLFPFHRFRVSK